VAKDAIGDIVLRAKRERSSASPQTHLCSTHRPRRLAQRRSPAAGELPAIPTGLLHIIREGLVPSPSGAKHTHTHTDLSRSLLLCSLPPRLVRRFECSPSHSHCSLCGVWSVPDFCATHLRSRLSRRRLWCLSLSLYDL
jgi:hypothetical protein